MTLSDIPNTVRILSVEDEPVVARRIERLSRDILGDKLQMFDQIGDLEQASSTLEHQKFDLLLLDLNLSGKDGFDLLARFTSYSSQTIVISAYTERAIDAFEYGVLDFVAKPFSKERLAKAFGRAFAVEPEAEHREMRFLTFRSGRRTDVVPLAQISCFRGADKYTEAVLNSGSTRLHDKTLSELERLLPSEFIRVHKSFIVPLDRIKELESSPGSKYDVLLDTGERVPVGRTRIAELRDRLSR